MKQPSNTVPPLVGPPTQRASFRDIFRPQHRRDAYFEASDRRGELYLLWMECVRFGVRMGYPCVLQEGDAAPLVFAAGPPDESEQNAALLRRWEELALSARAGELEIRALDRAAFRKKYHAFLGK